MTSRTTPYGQFHIGTKEELFFKAVVLAGEQLARTPAQQPFTWALTGGSTPLEWYRWAVAAKALPASLLNRTHFTVSDERFVPLTDKQSNFGNATDLLFNPLAIPDEQRHPWPVNAAPNDAAKIFAAEWANLVGPGRAFDVCFLGMGDDAHTASWFPGSPLLESDGGALFSGLEVPGKGFRLTVTPSGLRTCGLVVVMTLGANKAPALRRVLNDAYNPAAAPSQILKTIAKKVVWLVDPAAAGDL